MQATLGVLGALGDCTDGSCSVLLCGTTSATYSLHQGGVGAPLELQQRAWPLAAEGAPPAPTSARFAPLRLPAALCSDSAEVQAVLAAVGRRGGWAAGHARVTAAARLLAFFVGVSPRALVAHALRTSDYRRSPGEALFGAWPDYHSRYPTDANFAHPGTAAFLWALLARLEEKNSELRALTRKPDGSVNIQAVMDPACRWEQAVAPLAMEEVEAAFQGVARAAAPAAGAWAAAAAAAAAPPYPATMAGMLNNLADKQLLHLHHPGGSAPAQVWPVTAAQAGFRFGDDVRAAVAFEQAAKELALMCT